MKSEELIRTIAKVFSFILQLDQDVWICFRTYRGGIHVL